MKTVLTIAALLLISATPYVAPLEYGECQTRDMEYIVCTDLQTHVDKAWCDQRGWEYVWTSDGR